MANTIRVAGDQLNLRVGPSALRRLRKAEQVQTRDSATVWSMSILAQALAI
jgi:hypothetical protein